MLGKFYQYKDNKGTNWPLNGNMQVMLSLGPLMSTSIFFTFIIYIIYRLKSYDISLGQHSSEYNLSKKKKKRKKKIYK